MRPDKIKLAILSRRDNHQSAATVKMSFLIVAAFLSRLSRYTRLPLDWREQRTALGFA
jgi:hypothetical protein